MQLPVALQEASILQSAPVGNNEHCRGERPVYFRTRAEEYGEIPVSGMRRSILKSVSGLITNQQCNKESSLSVAPDASRSISVIWADTERLTEVIWYVTLRFKQNLGISKVKMDNLYPFYFKKTVTEDSCFVECFTQGLPVPSSCQYVLKLIWYGSWCRAEFGFSHEFYLFSAFNRCLATLSTAVSEPSKTNKDK
jgi:hypothetical protein